MAIIPVVMAGGSGTRLWPLSRQLYPKQFLPLLGDDTMLQETYGRLRALDTQPALFVCGESHRFIVAEQLRSTGCDPAMILLEPEGRNTAPAVALAACYALEHAGEGDDPVLLVLAADHAIQDVDAFQAAVIAALPFAEQGKLVTFGIVPSTPETGYGYIKCGDLVGNGPAKIVSRFLEKPAKVLAEQYLTEGGYLWNSGMFLFSARRYLDELQAHSPEILSVCQKAMSSASIDSDFLRPDKDIFLDCPADSIDYAVMEKTPDAVVVPMDCGWSDVGSWSALWAESEKDLCGNTLKGDVMALDTHDSFIQADRKLIATVGLRDVVIIESDDAILVADKNRVQEVKNIVDQLREEKRSEAEAHRKVFRPWGYYDAIENGERFQVKRILVKPGGRLSLQMHHHRAEHWVVVSGTALVTKGEATFLLSENESTFISIGETHRLENPGSIPLEIIEVQSGGYLGEDDIIRFEDIYKRN